MSFMAASCRRGQSLRVLFRGAPAWAIVAVAAWGTRADAAGLPDSFCPIEREPTLAWIRLAQGSDCARDEDGNGLDDEIEAALASCFVPEVRFDSRENALRIDEPHVLFSAYAIGTHLIRLHFAFLFARDGGYVLGTDFPCMTDDHDGDVESVAVDVTWTGRDGGWFGAPVSMRTRDPRDGAERVAFASRTANELTLVGTHPVLYATAGKHHWFNRPESLAYACNCGPLGRCGSVHDRADGAGPRITAAVLRHAPGFYSDQSRIRSQAPVDDEGRGFLNACAFGARGVLMPATLSLGSNDLGDLGYPGERVFGSCFRGGFGGPCAETVSVAQALSWERPFSTSFGARKLLSALLGSPSEREPGHVTVLLPFGAAPQSILRY